MRWSGGFPPPLRLYGSRVCLLDLSCWLIERPRALAFHLELPLPESAGKTTTRVEFESNTMNALTTLNTTNATLTMSSREIAELTGKEHFHVMRDIRDMLNALGEDESKFGGIYLDAYSREKPCYLLPKDLTITLVSGYNVQMRYAITKRWMELEAQQAPKLPTSFAEALRLAAELEEQKEQERATCT